MKYAHKHPFTVEKLLKVKCALSFLSCTRRRMRSAAFANEPGIFKQTNRNKVLYYKKYMNVKVYNIWCTRKQIFG